MSEPTAVTLDEVAEALKLLGIEVDDRIREVTITAGKVIVTRIRTDGEGQSFIAGQEIATTSTVIAVDSNG